MSIPWFMPQDDSVPITVEITPLPTSASPSGTPTSSPTGQPTQEPSATPTVAPTAPRPTATATGVPGDKPDAGLPGAGALGDVAPVVGGLGLLALAVAATVWVRRLRPQRR